MCTKRIAFHLLIFLLLTGCARPVESSTPLAAPPSNTAPPAPATPASTPVAAPLPTPLPRPRPVRTQYQLTARYDPDVQILEVVEGITYVNLTSEAIPNLILMVEANRSAGMFELNSLTRADGTPLEGYSLEGGVLTLPIPAPISPAGSLDLKLSYRLYLYEGDGILGANARQTNFGDWYPYLPPYLPGQGWVVRQPSSVGEHLAYDLADYQVEIQVNDPQNTLVIAASAPAESSAAGVFRYHLEAARSFAWSASREYQLLHSTVSGVELYAALLPEDLPAGNNALTIMGQALEFYSQRFGAYPHPSLTLVDAALFDGMEYEGLFFLDQVYFTTFASGPNSFLLPITAHETAHQWWYGMVGNDQALEPWLDEALCTYSELLFYQEKYPSDVSWWWDFRINRFQPEGWVDSTIYDHAEFRPYVNAVYLRGALFLDALRRQIGDESFLAFLKDYAGQYRQGWADRAGFFKVLGAHTQANLSDLVSSYFMRSMP